MLKNTLLIIICHFFSLSFAQKKNIDYSEATNWPKIEDPHLSNDGKYLFYYLKSKNISPVFNLQATDRSWKWETNNVINANFSPDNTTLILSKSADTICIFRLISRKIEYLYNVKSYKIPIESGEWFAYQSTSPLKQFIIRNLLTDEEIIYNNVIGYYISENHPTFSIVVDTLLNNRHESLLLYFNAENRKTDIIWRGGQKVTNVSFDHSGDQIAFTTEEDANETIKTAIWYFKPGMDNASLLVKSKTYDINAIPNYELFRSPFFSNDGSKIYFSIKKSILLKKDSIGTASVDIWSYNDSILNPAKKRKTDIDKNRSYLAVINLNNKNVAYRLQVDGDTWRIQLANGGNCNYVLTSSFNSDPTENYWRKNGNYNIYLVSTVDGSRIQVRKNVLTDIGINLSANGKYIIWFDSRKKHWFTFNISTHIVKNITKPITVPLYEDRDAFPNEEGPVSDIGGWLDDDKFVIIYDRYDIWKVDPDGVIPPKNITKGLGRERRISFRYMDFNRNFNIYRSIKSNEPLLLWAFDNNNKQNGFYRLVLSDNEEFLQLLYMGPYALYFETEDFFAYYAPRPSFPIKARNSETYILTKMNVNEYPNLYLTTDFKTFAPLTDLSPQKEFNWFDNELIHWKMFNGKNGEGILYKPENFNPKNKYPLIFYCYEQLSNYKNLFLRPDLSYGPLNIPWYVSNGYLVFIPNIVFKIGDTGESIYNSVVSAAKYFSNKPWVGKLGIQGHSFGGYEINYLLTQTNIFTAASSASGISDLISFSLSIMPGSGISRISLAERGQERLGNTLWKKRDIYINNSPIFKAYKVQTPLLIMHNEDDINVPWTQSVEWFLGLRRLGKKAWMLQYHGEGHTLDNEKNQLDYTIRLSQFFDHYLKNMPTPNWMLP